MDGRGNQLVFDCPAKHSNDMTDSFVDLVPANLGVDQGLTDRFQGEWSEVSGRFGAVKLPKGSEGELDVSDFGGGSAVLCVIGLGEVDVTKDDFGDGRIGRICHRLASACRRTSATGQPFSDKSVIFGTTGGRTVTSEVEISPRQRDHGLAGRFCEGDRQGFGR